MSNLRQWLEESLKEATLVGSNQVMLPKWVVEGWVDQQNPKRVAFYIAEAMNAAYQMEAKDGQKQPLQDSVGSGAGALREACDITLPYALYLIQEALKNRGHPIPTPTIVEPNHGLFLP